MLSKIIIKAFEYLADRLDELKQMRIETICEGKELDIKKAEKIEKEIKQIENIIR